MKNKFNCFEDTDKLVKRQHKPSNGRFLVINWKECDSNSSGGNTSTSSHDVNSI